MGKTTTIAKLAAHYRLKEKRRVGLITVDTYRIAAVEQLRTYADIIDLPMLVVSTPREMREAVRRQLALLEAPVDLVLHPRQSVLDLDFATLEREVAAVFRAVQKAAGKQLPEQTEPAKT